MPVLDFKEIAQANIANGEQDSFEFFARDFFEMIGFRIISGPDRGQDGGRDLLIAEERSGVMGKTEVKWLVSCKHKAHSGHSVLDKDEESIADRVRSHGAEGFIGFYSTIISAPLTRRLEGLRRDFCVEVMCKEEIESRLLDTPSGRMIAERYFPKSFEQWDSKNAGPSNVFTEYQPLPCVQCGKDLLATKQGVYVFVTDHKGDKVDEIKDFYCACKRDCDRTMEKYYWDKYHYITQWSDISDILIPVEYLRKTMAIMNGLRSGDSVYTDEAFDKLKNLLLVTAQLVVKKQTPEQVERAKDLITYSL